MDFGQTLKHPDSVVNFMAAYGTHPTITAATSIEAKRAAAQRLFDMDTADAGTPADAYDFVNSTGAWADSATGLDKSTCGWAASPNPRTSSAGCSALRSTTSSNAR